MQFYMEDCVSFSSFQNLRDTPLETRLSNHCVDFYAKIVYDFMERKNLHNNGTYSWNFWWQVYDPKVVNSKHPRHDHFSCGDDTIVSFVHFLKTNGDKCFRFVNDYNDGHSYVDEQDGDMIFFPSWALHDVLPPVTGVRAVISGNIMVTSHRSW